MKVFLSCVSSEFASYRTGLAAQLAALKPGEDPIEVKIQEDFSQGPFTLLERLAEYVRGCDAVVHLAGVVCGARPTPEHVRALYARMGWTLPVLLPERSYTQWEVQLALRFDRRLFCYFAGEHAPRDTDEATRQSTDECALQTAHVEWLQQSGMHYSTFENHNELLREVLRDLGVADRARICNLPFASIGSLFKGRDDFLGRLHNTLGTVQHRGLTRAAAITGKATTAIYGLGGIGKTRTAVEYAHRFADEYTALLFATADSPQALESNLARLTGAAVLNLPEKVEAAAHEQVAAVLRWLRLHPGWLLILDNVDTEESARAAEGMLSAIASAGHVIVTSRLSRWGAEVETLDLDLLDEASSTAFLLERTRLHRRGEADDLAHARELSLILGQLSLALEQAAAYINELECSFSDYVSRWYASHGRLIGYHDERTTHYPASVAVTWLTTFEQLTPDGRRLLQILAWLAPEPVPVTFMQAEGGPFAAEIAEPLDEPHRAALAEKSESALSNLRRYSLVSSSADKGSFVVHRLVQDVTRNNLAETDRELRLTAAVRWADGSFVGDPIDVRTWPVLDPLVPHVQSVVEFAERHGLSGRTPRLITQLARLFFQRAQWKVAEPLIRRALEINEVSHGPKSPEVALNLEMLGVLLKNMNRISEAEEVCRRGLLIWTSSEVADATPAQAIMQIAVLLQNMGRVEASEGAIRYVLETMESAFPPDSVHIGDYLMLLSRVLQDTNRLAEAEPALRRALAIFEANYGPDHPDVARALRDLAELLEKTSRFAEAEPLIRRALAIYQASYGPDHPDLARALGRLVVLLEGTKDFAEAEPLLRRALAIYETSYGPDALYVGFALAHLAAILQMTNRLAEAEPLLQRALEIFEKSDGLDRPRIAKALIGLAELLEKTSRFAEAEPLIRRALAIYQASYGPDALDVAIALAHLAVLLQNTNRLADAEPLMRRALEIYENNKGSDHAPVAANLSQLASLLESAKHYAEAEQLYRRALEIDEKNCGQVHPNIARDITNLGMVVWRNKNLEEAEQLFRRALEVDEKNYGPDDPKVAYPLRMLARLLAYLRREKEAESLMRRALELLLKPTRATGREHPDLRATIESFRLVLKAAGRTPRQIQNALRTIAPELNFADLSSNKPSDSSVHGVFNQIRNSFRRPRKRSTKTGGE